jgi:hypothetical protein
MNTELTAVVTTVMEPTPSLRRLTAALGPVRGALVVVGDEKGPPRFKLAGAEFLSLADQRKLPYSLASLLPAGHYARKNMGYLVAIGGGSKCIYETDDDNAPAASWRPRQLRTNAIKVSPRPWLNVYRFFSKDRIWPRGFPLKFANDPESCRHDPPAPLCAVEAPIQQGLVDGSPDVDAIWRLLLDREFFFRRGPSLWLPPGTWCPFNTQSTWWWPAAYPLLYLPSHCSFRMTDIWRSFVAQRCLWEMGFGMVFHAPEVVQSRNPHDLMRDFHDEVPGYLGNERLVAILSEIRLQQGAGAVGGNLLRCYEELSAAGFFPDEEVKLVRAWLRDLDSARRIPSTPRTGRRGPGRRRGPA